MWAIGALGGLLLGAMLGHDLWLLGALAGGFLGWLAGIVFRSHRQSQSTRRERQPTSTRPRMRANDPPATANATLAERLKQLEERLIGELAEIRRRLDRIDARLEAGGGLPAATPASEAPPASRSEEGHARSAAPPTVPPVDVAPFPIAQSRSSVEAPPPSTPAPSPILSETLEAIAARADASTSPQTPAPDIGTGEALAHAAATSEQVTAATPGATAPPLKQGQGVGGRGRPPAPPSDQGDWLTRAFSAMWEWLTGGNTVVRVGIIILFFGVAFLLKYAYDRVQVAIELRLAGVAIGAVVLLALGWRLRTHRLGYALTLQAGGIGLLYLTIFAAFRLYDVLPPTAAFALLVLVAAFSAMLAVLQDSRAFAVLGASGGFLAPVLASTGAGSHVMLFSYYAVLNGGIFAIAWFKAWRILNLVGFVFTFAIGTLWGARFYRPEFFASTEPFLVLFFLLYLAIPLLFARRAAPQLSHYVDGTLVFGLPIVAFGLQAALVKDFQYGSAYSALALAAIYLTLAKAVYTRAGERLRLLAESFLALGIVFGTLAIPLGLDGRWTSAAWALEGAAIVWIGTRQSRLLARVFGMLLQLAAGVAFLGDGARDAVPIAFVNSFYLGCFFVAVAGFFSAWYLERRRDHITATERSLPAVFFIWGLAWWVVGALREIDLHVPQTYRVQVALLYFSISCLAFSWLHRWIDWRLARYPALALLPIMTIAALMTVTRDTHPFAHIGFIAWPVAFAVHLMLLWRHEANESRYLGWLHAGGVWLFTALGAWEVAWDIDTLVQGRAVWPLVAWALVPAAILACLPPLAERDIWPVARHRDSYLIAGAAPIAVYLALWAIWTNLISDGDPAPLPYIPIVNPLDLAQIAAVLVVALWFMAGRRIALGNFATIALGPIYGLLGGGAFFWANAVLLRTIHHWADVPYRLDTMLRSVLVQTSFSIFWSLLALGAMVFATRRTLRPVWIAGAVLMVAVVAKLFLIDLSNSGTVERIVSFIGVGVLMLLIGYFSPVPPKTRASAQ
jgi:uncharacterized membrane protein